MAGEGGILILISADQKHPLVTQHWSEHVGHRQDLLDDPEDVSVSGIVALYLSSVKEKLQHELDSHGRPVCYENNIFWMLPPDPFFALCKSQSSTAGLDPSSLYYPKVFVWLPESLIGRGVITCWYYQDKSHPMTIKCWNDNPVAHRVVGLSGNCYIMTKHIQCRRSQNLNTTGCGDSFNYYDPVIMNQLDPGLVAEFPAFLTHRSGIDKTLMALIQAGISHRISASAWSKILWELHVHEHDMQELKYLHVIHKDQTFKKNLKLPVQTYLPFSEFDNKLGYAGFYPSRW